MRKKTSPLSTAAQLQHQHLPDLSSKDAPVVDGSGLRTPASTQRGAKRKSDVIDDIDTACKALKQSGGDTHPTASTSAHQAHLTNSTGTPAAGQTASLGDAHPASVSIDEQYWYLPDLDRAIIAFLQTWTKQSLHF